MPLRYVVLRHEQVDQPHFDLMFETTPGSALATWRSDEWPVTPRARLQPLGDHRRDYLEYEGPVCGNRGVVRRVASGTHVIEENRPDYLAIRVEGALLLKLPRAGA